jgi:hypothetical protein
MGFYHVPPAGHGTTLAYCHKKKFALLVQVSGDFGASLGLSGVCVLSREKLPLAKAQSPQFPVLCI